MRVEKFSRSWTRFGKHLKNKSFPRITYIGTHKGTRPLSVMPAKAGIQDYLMDSHKNFSRSQTLFGNELALETLFPDWTEALIDLNRAILVLNKGGNQRDST